MLMVLMVLLAKLDPRDLLDPREILDLRERLVPLVLMVLMVPVDLLEIQELRVRHITDTRFIFLLLLLHYPIPLATAVLVAKSPLPKFAKSGL